MTMGTIHHHRTLPVRSIRAFVWDFADEGIDDVLDRLGQARIDGVNLALAYHGGRFYCPHNPRRAIVHAPDGALYFQPLLSCYEELRPRVHPEYGSGAFVGRVGEALREREMALTAWVVLLNNLTLSMSHPEATSVNALGDRLEGALCPSKPAVRTYAQALVEDLAHRVGVDVIELEDFSFPTHDSYMGANWRGIEIGPNLGYLLGLCFCGDCSRRAEESNLEVRDLSYHVERMIRQGLAGDLTDRRIGDEIADPYKLISRYAEVRAETVTMLIDELNEAVEGSATLLQPIMAVDPDVAWRWGVELRALRQRLQRATLPASCTAGATHACIERSSEMLGLGRGLAADIHLRDGGEEHDSALPALVEACENHGVERFIFSHYGLARLDQLELIAELGRGR